MSDFTYEKSSAHDDALRGMGITDSHVLSALEQIPRDLFVPPALRDHAYENASLPIALEQTISQPYIVAIMTAALQLTGHEARQQGSVRAVAIRRPSCRCSAVVYIRLSGLGR